ncbi:MAG: hypothetical protein EOO86_04145 [Pedobacter sp.]|nr:MAG: hypothetical protein EOO86_04145 [Pedobacter sp.]
MGIAQDFLDSFFAAYPDANNGKLSLEELNLLMAAHQKEINDRGIVEFDGLSPSQMNLVLNRPLSEGCVITFRKNMEAVVEQSPFFKLSQILLEQIDQSGNLKLTPIGNLPVKICELLCKDNLIYWQYMKYVKKIQEDNVPYLSAVKFALIESGLVKRRNNSLSLTTKGLKRLKGAKQELFIHILSYFTGKLHWGNLYNTEYNSKCGKFGWAYSLFLLSKYGSEERESEFYSDKLMQAFHGVFWDTDQKNISDEETRDFNFAYENRFFECFACWFGLAELDYKRKPEGFGEILYVKKTSLFDLLFEVKR